ncbi:MAG TPA: hypothetical protein VLA77_04315 [Candidatus Saccharimonadales bacterium]|nr:hypothetical protein [Candidatus Saccharimonadales bacterium]
MADFVTPTRPTIFRSSNGHADLFFVPGYNGNSQSLHEILAPWTRPYATAGIQYAPGRFDGAQAELAVRDFIREHGPEVVYSESMGAPIVLGALRRGATIDTWVINAGPASPSNVRPWQTIIGSIMHGGPGLTALMQLGQRASINWITTDASRMPASQAAYERSTHLTSPMAFGMMEYLRSFEPVQPGELVGKVRRVIFVSAPGEYDDRINTANASGRWMLASGTMYSRRILSKVPRHGHCMTPEYPEGVGTVLYELLES